MKDIIILINVILTEIYILMWPLKVVLWLASVDSPRLDICLEYGLYILAVTWFFIIFSFFVKSK